MEMEPDRKQFPDGEISPDRLMFRDVESSMRMKDPRGSRYLKGSNSRKVETDPDDRSPQMEILLKERIPWKEPDGTTVLTGETPRDSSQPGFKRRNREAILCGD